MSVDDSVLSPPPLSWPDHTGRLALLRACLEGEPQLDTHSPASLKGLAKRLLKTVPEWQAVDDAYVGWVDGAARVRKLRGLLELAPDDLRSLRNPLDAALAEISTLPQLRAGEWGRGYQAGLDAARRDITLRAQQHVVSDHELFRSGRHVVRHPGTPVELPTEAEQTSRFATVLSPMLGSEADRMARTLQTVVAPNVAEPDSYQVAHHQWRLHSQTVSNLEDQLGPVRAPRRAADELDRLAAQLLPSQSVPPGGFPAGFQAGYVRAAAALSSCARRLRGLKLTGL